MPAELMAAMSSRATAAMSVVVKAESCLEVSVANCDVVSPLIWSVLSAPICAVVSPAIPVELIAAICCGVSAVMSVAPIAVIWPAVMLPSWLLVRAAT